MNTLISLFLLPLLHGPAQPEPMSVTGSCKNVEITFKNGTDERITIPQKGHRVKNPGSVEGWNKFELGGSDTVPAGQQASSVVKLSIKCVTDAEFEIHWNDLQGNDHYDRFESVNITDGKATFNLHLGGVCANATAEVSADGIVLGLIKVRTLDPDASLVVDGGDVDNVGGHAGEPGGAFDVDCSGLVDTADVALVAAHKGHTCDHAVPAKPASWGEVKTIYR